MESRLNLMTSTPCDNHPLPHALLPCYLTTSPGISLLPSPELQPYQAISAPKPSRFSQASVPCIFCFLSLWQQSLLFVAQSLIPVRLFATPWTAARQASLSFIISQSLLKLMSLELLMPSNHLILCRPLLLPSIFPRIRVFSSESTLHIGWPKYWTFSFSISRSSKYLGLISFRID